MKNKMFLSPGQLCTVLCAALLICGLALSTSGDHAKIVAEKTWRPQYTTGGELIRPTDFHHSCPR